MRATARVALLGWGAIAIGVRAGAEPLPPAFTPSDPRYVVLELPSGSGVSSAERARTSRDAKLAAATAGNYLARARSERDPALFARAETLLQPWMAHPENADAALLILQADIEQHRHAFERALTLLGLAISREPQNARARLMRASVHMVRGDAQAARRDCQAMLGAGAAAVASVCVAQAVGTGDPVRGVRLVRTWLERGQAFTPEQRAWALEILADLEMRSGNVGAAEAALREAVQSWPGGETARIALADLLNARARGAEALALLDIERPSTAARVQRARAHRQLGRRTEMRAETELVRRLLSVENGDGRRVHLREEAQLALYLDDEPQRALRLARDNFSMQRESVDVRLFADAARAADDEAAMRELRAWMQGTGASDAYIERLLVGENR